MGYEAKLAWREQKMRGCGGRLGGKPPRLLFAGLRAQDWFNLTDEESRIMPVAGGGFEQACNVQAVVDVGSVLVVVLDVTHAGNGKEQVVPMLGRLAMLLASLGQPLAFVADMGFYGARNVAAREAYGIDPFMAVKWVQYYPAPRGCFTELAALLADLCSVSSNPCSVFVSFLYAASSKSRVNGPWFASRGI